MKFKIDDMVSILNEPLKGKVLNVGPRIRVLLEDGFEESFLPSQLAIYSKATMNIELEIKDDITYSSLKSLKTSEMDLHFDIQRMKIHNIESNEVLRRQLTLLEEEIRESIKNKVDRLIVIHGIGKGILKKEVILLSKKFSNISIHNLYESRYKNCAIALHFVYNI